PQRPAAGQPTGHTPATTLTLQNPMAHKKKLVYLLHDIALGGAEIAFLSALPALHRAFRLRVYVLQRMDEALLGSLPPELRACIIHYPLPASRLPFRLPGLLRQIRRFRP